MKRKLILLLSFVTVSLISYCQDVTIDNTDVAQEFDVIATYVQGANTSYDNVNVPASGIAILYEFHPVTGYPLVSWIMKAGNGCTGIVYTADHKYYTFANEEVTVCDDCIGGRVYSSYNNTIKIATTGCKDN